MQKKSTINTITAGAMARQIVKTIKEPEQKVLSKKENVIKSDPMYKKLLAIRIKNREYDRLADNLRSQLNNKYRHADISYDGNVRIREIKSLSTSAIADEIIILHNVNGKPLDQITKELTAKYS